MAIPLETTLISVQRSTVGVDVDPSDAPPAALTPVASGVRAVINTPSASVVLSSGDRVVYTAGFSCDPCDVIADDTVTESDGTQWMCLWARPQVGLGLDHVEGQLRLVTGAS